MEPIVALEINRFTAFEASVMTGQNLGNMAFGRTIHIAFGIVGGVLSMLVRAPECQCCFWGTSVTNRLSASVGRRQLLPLKRKATLQLAGRLQQLGACPRPLHPKRDWWFPQIANPMQMVGANPYIAVDNFGLQTLIAELVPFALHQVGGPLQPARFVPVHNRHERDRANAFPTTSRIPGSFRDDSVVQLEIEKLPATPEATRFGQAALALANASGNADRAALSCPVLQAFANARPVFRCRVFTTEELLPALRMDTSIRWSVAEKGRKSEIEAAYSGTEVEDFESFLSEHELQNMLAAFFVPATRNTTA